MPSTWPTARGWRRLLPSSSRCCDTATATVLPVQHSLAWLLQVLQSKKKESYDIPYLYCDYDFELFRSTIVEKQVPKVFPHPHWRWHAWPGCGTAHAQRQSHRRRAGHKHTWHPDRFLQSFQSHSQLERGCV